jgi:hypothetical protein
MSQPPFQPFNHHTAAPQDAADDHERMLREVEQELEEEERGEVPDPTAGAGLRSALLVVGGALVLAGVLAGVGVLTGLRAWVGAVFGLLGGACLGTTIADAGRAPRGPEPYRPGYDGAAILAVLGILFFAWGFLCVSGLLI